MDVHGLHDSVKVLNFQWEKLNEQLEIFLRAFGDRIPENDRKSIEMVRKHRIPICSSLQQAQEYIRADRLRQAIKDTNDKLSEAIRLETDVAMAAVLESLSVIVSFFQKQIQREEK